MRIIYKFFLLAVILIFASASSGNIFFPDGVGNGNPQINQMTKETAAAFINGVARTYDMLSKVEMVDIDGAQAMLGQAIKEFTDARNGCKDLKSAIASDKQANYNLQKRIPVLGEKLRMSYVMAKAIPNEKTKWDEVLSLTKRGELDGLVGLSENSASTMIGMLEDYREMLGQKGGPTLVENWRLANKIEMELQTLRYAAIMVKGPIEVK